MLQQYGHIFNQLLPRFRPQPSLLKRGDIMDAIYEMGFGFTVIELVFYRGVFTYEGQVISAPDARNYSRVHEFNGDSASVRTQLYDAFR